MIEEQEQENKFNITQNVCTLTHRKWCEFIFDFNKFSAWKFIELMQVEFWLILWTYLFVFILKLSTIFDLLKFFEILYITEISECLNLNLHQIFWFHHDFNKVFLDIEISSCGGNWIKILRKWQNILNRKFPIFKILRNRFPESSSSNCLHTSAQAVA